MSVDIGIFSDLLWVICLSNVDDLIIFAKSELELLKHIDIVLTRLHDVGLKLKPSKCTIFRTEIEFLGHVVSSDGIKPLPGKSVSYTHLTLPTKRIV